MADGPTELDPQDLRLIELIGRGWTDERIARELGTSRTSVQRAIRQVARHLGARSRITIVMRAIQVGEVTSEDIAAWDLE